MRSVLGLVDDRMTHSEGLFSPGIEFGSNDLKIARKHLTEYRNVREGTKGVYRIMI